MNKTKPKSQTYSSDSKASVPGEGGNLTQKAQQKSAFPGTKECL